MNPKQLFTNSSDQNDSLPPPPRPPRPSGKTPSRPPPPRPGNKPLHLMDSNINPFDPTDRFYNPPT
jgi:hypothetical protein